MHDACSIADAANFFRNPKIVFQNSNDTTNVVNGNIQVEDHRIKLPKLKWRENINCRKILPCK